jgi:hypothetical protein
MAPRPREHAVLCYSRDGHTDRLAKLLAEALDADIFRIVTRRYGGRRFGYLRAGFDSLTGRLPEIAPVQNLGRYASLSLGAPIWTSYPATPLRAYLAGHPQLPGAVGLFVSSGSRSPPEKAFAMARDLLGRPLAATLSVPEGLDEQASAARIEAYRAAIVAASGVGRAA